MEKELLDTLNTLTDKLNNLDKQIIELIQQQEIDRATDLVTQRNKLINVMTTLYAKLNVDSLDINLKGLLEIIEQKVSVIFNNNNNLITLFEAAKEAIQTEIALTTSNRKKLNGYNFTSRHL